MLYNRKILLTAGLLEEILLKTNQIDPEEKLVSNDIEITINFEPIPNKTYINDLDLSVRTFNLLNSLSIWTLEKLETFSEEDLRKTKGIGSIVISEIKQILSERGKSLRA